MAAPASKSPVKKRRRQKPPPFDYLALAPPPPPPTLTTAESSVMRASRANVTSDVLKLLSSDNKEARAATGRTPLLEAVANDNEAVVATLVASLRCDVNVQENADCGGRSALMLAAERGNVALMRLLLEAGASVHAKDAFGRTALHAAARAGSDAGVVLLLSKGASGDAVDDRGLSPQALAAEYGHALCASLLPVVAYDWMAVAEAERVSRPVRVAIKPRKGAKKAETKRR